MTCFECNQRIDSGKCFEVRGKQFHWGCVRSILEQHITDRSEREQAYDHQAINEDKTDEEIADELGYFFTGPHEFKLDTRWPQIRLCMCGFPEFAPRHIKESEVIP